MLKFFRRYRNWILAVGGSILMVAFLLGSIIGQLGQLAPSPTVATITIDGKLFKVKLQERQRTGMEIEMFKQVFGPLIDTQLDRLGEYDDGDSDTSPLEGPLHWQLLKLQAEQAGLQGGVGDARNFLMREAANVALYDPTVNGNIDLAYQQILNRLRAASGRLTQRETLLAVADFLAVQRLVGVYHGAQAPSDYRLKSFADQFLGGVNVVATLVDAEFFIEDEPAPSEAAQQAQFVKYAAVLPGEGEFGLGYRLPDRLQLEYLVIDFQSILDSIEVSALDANLWFKKQSPESLLTTPDQAEPPTFENSRPAAILAHKTELAEAKMKEIINAVKAKLLRSSRGLSRDGDYRVLPEDWAAKRISFPDLQQEIQTEFNVRVSYTAIGDRWILVADPSDIGALALAQRAAGSQFATIGDVLRSYRAFGDPEIPSLQAGIADIEPFRSRSYRPILGRNSRTPAWTDAIFMRVTTIDPARPAATLDEVRPEVIRDLKRIAVYERLKTEQAEYLARATEEGVRKLAEDLGTRSSAGRIVKIDAQALGAGDGFIPTSIRSIGKDIEFSNAILARAQEINEIGDVKALPRDERTVIAPIPGKLGLAIAEIERISPMTAERFQAQLSRPISFRRSPAQPVLRYGFADVYAAYELDNEIPGINPFSFEALSKRFNLQWEDEWVPEPDEFAEESTFGSGETDADTTAESN